MKEAGSKTVFTSTIDQMWRHVTNLNTIKRIGIIQSIFYKYKDPLFLLGMLFISLFVWE